MMITDISDDHKSMPEEPRLPTPTLVLTNVDGFVFNHRTCFRVSGAVLLLVTTHSFKPLGIFVAICK